MFHATILTSLLSKSRNLSVMFLKLILLFFIVLGSTNGGVDSIDAEVILTDMNPIFYPQQSTQSSQTILFDLNGMIDSDINVEDEVDFHLFTNANKETSYLLKIGDLKNLIGSYFDFQSPTKVIVHGWTDSADTYWYNNYRNNYLTVGNYNLILVDWSSSAAKEYFTSSKLTRPVGEYLGKLLSFLEENGKMSLSNVHILGHSLGAHVAGIAGLSLSGKVGRITGMDPASPGFEVPFLIDLKDRLDSSDAKFVDVIHTCSGSVGFTLPIGHVDFYPNGGTFLQPGCPPLISQYCSHARSHQFMSESIVRPEGFLSTKCENWKSFVAGRCNPANSETTYMGEMVNENIRGSFYLKTNPQQPFGQS